MNETIRRKFDLMIPSPTCELNYHSDYSLLVAIMLSAQSTDKKVNKITPTLFSVFSDPSLIDENDYLKIEEIIRPLGLSKIKAQNIIRLSKMIYSKFGGVVPNNYNDLCLLPGIGNKTAKVFLVEYYHYNYFPVDTHVERVAKRIGIAFKDDSIIKVEEKLVKYFNNKNLARLHQQFVLHGRYICKAIKPNCDKCLLNDECLYFRSKD